MPQIQRFCTALVLCASALWCAACSGESPAGEPTLTPQADSRPQQLAMAVDSLMHHLMAETATPGAAIALVKDSTIILLKGYGVKATATRDTLNIHSVFRIASLSKGISGLLTALLVRDSLLAWDGRVNDYLPDFHLKEPDYSARLTVRHLLSNSTGMVAHAYTNLIEHGFTIERILPLFARVKLVAPPGQYYAYQNASFSLIAPLLQTATGVDFSTLAQQRLFVPLGMENASIGYEAMKADSNKALPHLPADSTWVNVRLSRRYYNAAPAGGINASIHDMAQLLQALLGNRPHIADAALLDTLFTPRVTTTMGRRFNRYWKGMQSAHYALGWRILHFEQDTLIYHGGYVNGYRSELALDRQEKWAVCVLTNAAGGLAGDVLPAFRRLYRRYYPQTQAPALLVQQSTDDKDDL